MLLIIMGISMFAFLPFLIKILNSKEKKTNDRIDHLTEKVAENINKPLTKAEIKENRMNELADKVESGRITSEELKELFELSGRAGRYAIWK